MARSTLLQIFGTLGAFVVGFAVMKAGPELYDAQIRPALVNGGWISPGELVIPACDAAKPACAAEIGREAARRIAIGKTEEAQTLYRHAAFAGDARSAFMAGWLHDEAYRAVVGTRLRSYTPIPELESQGETVLPRGPGFATVVAAVDAASVTPADRHRRLAYLFYLRAAIDGFAPAMNNLGAMHQFGLIGAREREPVERWYERAAMAGNPVALLNLVRLWVRDMRDGSVSCERVQKYGGGAQVRVTTMSAEDREDEILDRTRFRGRPMPEEIRDLALGGGWGRSWGRVLKIGGVTMPAISQAELRALVREQPRGWNFDGDPDENEADLPRFRKNVDLDALARTCVRSASRTSERDHSKLARLRSMQDTIDRPRRTYSSRWW